MPAEATAVDSAEMALARLDLDRDSERGLSAGGEDGAAAIEAAREAMTSAVESAGKAAQVDRADMPVQGPTETTRDLVLPDMTTFYAYSET